MACEHVILGKKTPKITNSLLDSDLPQLQFVQDSLRRIW